MIRGVKVLLVPTKEQEALLFNYVDKSRAAYNWGVEKCEERRESEGKIYTYNQLSSMFTQYKKENTYFNDVDSHTTKRALRNVIKAYKRYFDRKSSKPKFKSYKKARKSFYTRNDRLKLSKNNVQLSSIGVIKSKVCHKYLTPLLSDTLGEIEGLLNPTVCYDNKYWYLTFGIEVPKNIVSTKLNESIGVDLGINVTMYRSDGVVERNIHKDMNILKLKRRKKILQRKLSRKYELNKDVIKGVKVYKKTRNVKRLEKRISLIDRRISNLRLSYYHTIVNKLVKLYPKRIVIEDLDINKMKKNKHIAPYIQEQSLYKLRLIVEAKCEKYGVELVIANRYYPSSKLCSCCGVLKKGLNLDDRLYKCDNCGLLIDRDRNASINLSKYRK